jgi:hypothetical protein
MMEGFLSGFRNTIGRAKYMLNAWQESGRAGLYKPRVISRHEYGYRPWLSDCLNAARTRMAPLGPEELDRVTVVAFWRGYVDSTGKELRGDERKEPDDMVLVDIGIETHETTMGKLHEMGLFEMFKDEGSKLLNDCQQRRQPGATMIIAFNELWKPAPCAAVVQIMKNDPDLDMGEISDVAALRKKK